MFNKAEITRRVLELLPESDRPSYDDARQWWWQDPREDSGLRLTLAGFDVLATINEFETHCFDIPPATPAKPSQLITLNRKLDCPYFIKLGKKPQLYVFGSQQAVMLAMYGDFLKFIKYLERS